MTTTNFADEYAFGNTGAEHERLIRQAARLAPLTERFFREAGISAGAVLDLGSGVGDVRCWRPSSLALPERCSESSVIPTQSQERELEYSSLVWPT
jgi:hypothetical protein